MRYIYTHSTNGIRMLITLSRVIQGLMCVGTGCAMYSLCLAELLKCWVLEESLENLLTHPSYMLLCVHEDE